MATTSLTLIQIADFSGNDGGDFTKVRGFASNATGTIFYTAVNNSVGIFKSTNSGASWTGVLNTPCSSVACSSDGVIVYAAYLGQGLWKSTDSGASWSYIVQVGQALPNNPLPGYPTNPEIGVGYNFGNVYQVACDSTGNNLLMTTNYAAVIYRSTDGGATWANVYVIPSYSITPNSPTLVASNSNGSILYSAFNNTDQNIYTSTNNGTSWTLLNTYGVSGPYFGLTANLAGDFLFASDGSGNLNIVYTTHADKSVLTPVGGSLIRACCSYNNGNNIILMQNNATQTYLVGVQYPPAPIPGSLCFKEGSKILCFVDGKEVYLPVETMTPGILVKTSLDGYKKVELIGSSKFYNTEQSLKSKKCLYICKPENYPELIEPLVITSDHAILVPIITDKQRAELQKYMGDIFVTDRKYRLIACLDERAVPYTEEGIHTVWHFALEHENYYMNYGIYANGLLVETSSKRMIKEKSGMQLL